MIPKLFFKLENKKFESNLNYFFKKKQIRLIEK